MRFACLLLLVAAFTRVEGLEAPKMPDIRDKSKWIKMTDTARGTHTVDDERVPGGRGCGASLVELTRTAELDALLAAVPAAMVFFVHGGGEDAASMRAAAALAATTAPSSVCSVATSVGAVPADSSVSSVNPDTAATGLHFVIVDTSSAHEEWAHHSGFMGRLPTPSARLVFHAAARAEEWGAFDREEVAEGGGAEAKEQQEQQERNATANEVYVQQHVRARDVDLAKYPVVGVPAEKGAAAMLLWLDLVEHAPVELRSETELQQFIEQHGHGALLGCFDDGKAEGTGRHKSGATRATAEEEEEEEEEAAYMLANTRALQAFTALAAQQEALPMAVCRSAALCRAAGRVANTQPGPTDIDERFRAPRWDLPVAMLVKRSEAAVQQRELPLSLLEPWVPHRGDKTKGSDQDITVFGILRQWVAGARTHPFQEHLPPVLRAHRIVSDPARCRDDEERAVLAKEMAAATAHKHALQAFHEATQKGEAAEAAAGDGATEGPWEEHGLRVTVGSAKGLHTLFVFARDDDGGPYDGAADSTRASASTFEALRAAYWTHAALPALLHGGGGRLQLIATTHPAAPPLMREFGLDADASLPAVVLANATGWQWQVMVQPAPLGTAPATAPTGVTANLFANTHKSFRGHVFRLDEQQEEVLQLFRSRSATAPADTSDANADARFGGAAPESLCCFFRAFKDGGGVMGALSADAVTVGNTNLQYTVKSSRPWPDNAEDAPNDEDCVHTLTGANFGPLMLGSEDGHTTGREGVGTEWCTADAFVYVGHVFDLAACETLRARKHLSLGDKLRHMNCEIAFRDYEVFRRGAAQLRAELAASHAIAAAKAATAAAATAVAALTHGSPPTAEAREAEAEAATTRTGALLAIAAAREAHEAPIPIWRRTRFAVMLRATDDEIAAAVAATAAGAAEGNDTAMKAAAEAASAALAAATRRAKEQVRFFRLDPAQDRPDHDFEPTLKEGLADPLRAKTVLFFAAAAAAEGSTGAAGGRCVGAGGTRIPALASTFPSRIERLLKVAHHLGAAHGEGELGLGMGPAPLEMQRAYLHRVLAPKAPSLPRDPATFEPREPTPEEVEEHRVALAKMMAHQEAHKAKQAHAKQAEQMEKKRASMREAEAAAVAAAAAKQREREAAGEFSGIDMDEL